MADLITLADTDALWEHLNGLNESGVEPLAAGVDAHGRPFLAFLAGCYADPRLHHRGRLIIDSPWAGEVGYAGGVCDECCAQRGVERDTERLLYPLLVIRVDR